MLIAAVSLPIHLQPHRSLKCRNTNSVSDVMCASQPRSHSVYVSGCDVQVILTITDLQLVTGIKFALSHSEPLHSFFVLPADHRSYMTFTIRGTLCTYRYMVEDRRNF